MDDGTAKASSASLVDTEAGYESTNTTPQLRSVYTEHRLTGISKTRLVHVLPGCPHEPIKCNLLTADLHDIGQYEALSYVWGTRLGSEKISVNGTPFSVTKNLFLALEHLRLEDRERVLWIDAICINQSDLNERNHQVRRMADIYSRSRRVISWLGMDTEASRMAFEFLAQVHEYAISVRGLEKRMMDWLVLEDVYQRNYWSRVWIVQEICLAREVVVVCGDTEIPLTNITTFRKQCMHLSLHVQTQGERDFMRSPLSRIDHAREIHRSSGCLLWTLLESFKDWKCQDVHDRIYGFLGLVSDCGNGEISIDYSKLVGQLYQDVVRFYYGVFQTDSSYPISARIMTFGDRAFYSWLRSISQAIESEL